MIGLSRWLTTPKGGVNFIGKQHILLQSPRLLHRGWHPTTTKKLQLDLLWQYFSRSTAKSISVSCSRAIQGFVCFSSHPPFYTNERIQFVLDLFFKFTSMFYELLGKVDRFALVKSWSLLVWCGFWSIIHDLWDWNAWKSAMESIHFIILYVLFHFN